MNESYWGSVRFFRHLYTAAFIGLLCIPVLVCFYFWQVGFAATRDPGRLQKERLAEAGLESVHTGTFPIRKNIRKWSSRRPENGRYPPVPFT